MPKIYGSVVVNGVVYTNQEIAKIKNPGAYGANWKFDGDLDLDECDIYIEAENGAATFTGHRALNRALVSLANSQQVNQE